MAYAVDILDVQPFPQVQWGYTGAQDLSNSGAASHSGAAILEREGGGLLASDLNTHAAKAIWDFEGVYASSRHVPGVRFAGALRGRRF